MEDARYLQLQRFFHGVESKVLHLKKLYAICFFFFFFSFLNIAALSAFWQGSFELFNLFSYKALIFRWSSSARAFFIYFFPS